MSKVRRFDMPRIEAEIDWLGCMRVERVMLADANFGILPRDTDIADMFNDARSRHEGYPRFIFYSAAKNHPDRSTDIALKFARSGICTIHALSIQHTRKEVLAATNRSNISPAKQVAVVKAMMVAGVPIEVQLIQGIPGDTRAMWAGCLADLMEWGVHEDYLIQAYRLLPNAPAADEEFRRRWQVRTIERVTYDLTSRQVQRTDHVAKKREKIVVGSSTFSEQDWVEMSTYSAFIKALHNGGLTQYIATYLRLTHGVPYLDFYQHLIGSGLRDESPPKPWFQDVMAHYEQYLGDADASDHMAVKELPDLPIELHPSRWLYVQICLDFDAFYDWAAGWLCKWFPGIDNLREVVEYERDLVILPSYNRDIGKTFRINHDWPSYFLAAWGREGSEGLAEPSARPGTILRASDRTSGQRPVIQQSEGGGYYGEPLDWAEIGDGGLLWNRWIERCVLGRSAAAMRHLHELTVASTPPN
jgi:putative methyltransferase